MKVASLILTIELCIIIFSNSNMTSKIKSFKILKIGEEDHIINNPISSIFIRFQI